MFLLVRVYCVNISIPFTFLSARDFNVFMSSPYIYTEVCYPSVFLSYIVCVRLVQTVIHPLQVVTHSTPQAWAFPEIYKWKFGALCKFQSQLRYVCNHSLPNYEKISLKQIWPLTLKMIWILYIDLSLDILKFLYCTSVHVLQKIYLKLKMLTDRYRERQRDSQTD